MPNTEWNPQTSTEFEDLIESPRWYQPPFVLAAVSLGAVASAVGLVVAVLLGRDVSNAAWSAPAALAALAGTLWGLPKRKHETETYQPGPGPKELRGTSETSGVP
jgi:hypothetical protein